MSDNAASPFASTNHLGDYDLAIIGAGPAGMSAAATAAENGLRVALIDAARQLGGQYFRHPPPGLTAPWLPKLYHGWELFEDLVTRVETTSGIEVLFGHQVWAIEPGFKVLTDRGPIEAPYVLLATGAYERVVPFPGWDLPGVLTAGGAQALLKGNLVLPGRRVVVAGTGPLLLPVAAGLATAGAKVLGLYEANAIRGYAKNPIPLLTNPTKLAEGLDYARQFTRARIPMHTNRMVIEAQGTDALEAVIVARPDGADPEHIPCDTLAIGYGLAPQIELALTLGAEATHLADGTVALRVTTTQRTTIPGLYAAGETAGVAGADTALTEGEIAALAIARAVNRTRAANTTAATPAATAPSGPLATRTLAAARARLSRSNPGSGVSSPSTDTPSAAMPEPAAAKSEHGATDLEPAASNSEPAAIEAKRSRSLAARPLAAARARLTRTTTAATTAPEDLSATPTAPTPAMPAPAPPPPNLATLLRRRTRQRALADLLRARHPIPAAWQTHLTPDTLVCRCEEVPASAITEAVADLGATDARTAKLLTRAGMGWCQGRVCGYAVACLARTGDAADTDATATDTDTGAANAATEADLLAAAKRPLARPVPLSVLAEQDQRNK